MSGSLANSQEVNLTPFGGSLAVVERLPLVACRRAVLFRTCRQDDLRDRAAGQRVAEGVRAGFSEIRKSSGWPPGGPQLYRV